MFKGLFNRKEDEEQAKLEGRLPPGQVLTNRFPVLHYGPVPKVNLATWDFRVFGEVEAEGRWNWEQFNQLPRTKITMDIHCVTRWSKLDTTWEGIHVRTLVEQGIIKPRPNARFVIQHCEHGYTTNTPIEVVLAENFILATHYDGKPLDLEHGYPLRGVIGAMPGKHTDTDRYFWKGGKWLRGLEFVTEDKLGFWEQAGYNNEANIWKEQRYSYGGW